MSTLQPRGSADTCIKCRKKLKPGDRVQPIYIVEKTGANPGNLREMGAYLLSEFEMAHISCRDPELRAGFSMGAIVNEEA
jgi:hypothetical protein